MARKTRHTAPILTNAAGKPMDQWTPAEWGEFLLERIRNYEGDAYLVDSLVDTEEYTVASARREVQDPKTLMVYLAYDMLPQILADRAASDGLKHAILSQNADVIQALADAVKRLRVRKKSGPKAVGGAHLYQSIIKLRDEERLTWKEISRRVYETPTKWGLVKAHYYMGKKRVAAR
jgi:hypothetical protein